MEKAIEWWKKSAENGNAQSQKCLELFANEGTSNAKNVAKKCTKPIGTVLPPKMAEECGDDFVYRTSNTEEEEETERK